MACRHRVHRPPQGQRDISHRSAAARFLASARASEWRRARGGERMRSRNMTGADKIVCQAATLLLLFTLTLTPAKAQFGGGGGGQDMMTQMAPMLEMMKAKMGKRRFAAMMQTMGPMMSRMTEGGGGLAAWWHDGRRRNSRLRRRYGGGDVIRRHEHRRPRRRRADEHGPATDAHGQCRRRPSRPASPAAVVISIIPATNAKRLRKEPTGQAHAPDDRLCDEAIHLRYCVMDCFAEPVIGRAFARPGGSCANASRCAGNDAYHDSAGRTAAALAAASAPIGSTSR